MIHLVTVKVFLEKANISEKIFRSVRFFVDRS